MTRTEEQIVRQCIADLLAAGFAVSVNDGEETTLKASQDAAAIFAAMGTTDEDWLLTHRDGEPRHFSFVRFIYGNAGWEVLNDHGIGLAPALARTERLVDELEAAA